jgi:hypothetical protein
MDALPTLKAYSLESPLDKVKAESYVDEEWYFIRLVTRAI